MSNEWTDTVTFEPAGQRFKRKAKENPFVVAGLAGMFAVCALGAYKYKSKGDVPTSVFLLQLRVVAQATFVGSLVAGAATQMIHEMAKDLKPLQK